MELNGVPLHPLVIHAVVVFVPLAALAAVLMAWPRWRWLARWPALLLTLGATAACYVATVSGAELFLYPGDAHLFTDRTLEAYDADATALVLRRIRAQLAD